MEKRDKEFVWIYNIYLISNDYNGAKAKRSNADIKNILPSGFQFCGQLPRENQYFYKSSKYPDVLLGYNFIHHVGDVDYWETFITLKYFSDKEREKMEKY